MATTTKGIYYPENYDAAADILADMKQMAESMNTIMTNSDNSISDIQTNIFNIKAEQIKQNINTQKNTRDIKILEDNQIQCMVTGKNIYIEDSAGTLCVDISLQGESIQEGEPTPDNPIEIENVEGNVEVKVEGKNLAQINKGDVNSYRLIHSIPVKKGEKITVIFKGTETNNSRLGCYLYADETLASSTAVYLQSIPVDNTEALTTITIPNSGYFSIACSYGYQAVTVEKIFVGKGEYTLDDYEEYKSQTAYFPLAEGQKLMEGSYLSDDGIHNKRKQVVFDGTETLTIFTYGTAHVNTTIFKFSALISKMNGALKYSSHFKVRDNTVTTLNTDDNWVMNDSSGSVFICIENTKASTVEEMKAYLAEQYANGAPIILEYKLAEEEMAPYTEEQQKAWNELKDLQLFKRVNNIQSQAIIKLIYIKDTNKVVLNLQEQINELKQAIVSLGGN